MRLYLVCILLIMSLVAGQQNTDNNPFQNIDINTLQYKYEAKQIKDYWAVTKIYPQLEVQMKKAKQLQANKVQNLPKQDLKNQNKEIKWRLNNNFQLPTFVIDQDGVQVQLQQTNQLATVKQPKKLKQSAQQIKTDSAIAKQQKNSKPSESSKEAKTIQSKVIQTKDQMHEDKYKYLLIIILIVSLALYYVHSICKKREKGLKSFQYKSINNKTQIQTMEDQSQVMYNSGQSSIIYYKQNY